MVLRNEIGRLPPHDDRSRPTYSFAKEIDAIRAPPAFEKEDVNMTAVGNGEEFGCGYENEED